MPQFQHNGTKPVNLGGGHFLMPGQRTELTTEQANALPGLEPVLEREPPKRAVEGVRGRQAVEKDRRQANLNEG